jgi:mannose-6-phosphate isomerase-like protein (cupin superfamily)
MIEKTVINIDDMTLVDRGDGKQFAVKWGRVERWSWRNGLGCAVHIVPPGTKAFPFPGPHVQDALFFVVSGKGEYRFGEKIVPVRRGDIVARRPAQYRLR